MTAQAEDMEAETSSQKFHVDFLIMSETLSKLLKDLLSALIVEPDKLLGEKIVSEAAIPATSY